ncbi:hypothetical protein CHARACLAT_018962 [Characodon lateralis]|uniref:Uncharacterized protein n=1 Tax=Characodon lateralis TaxID=208331 RepID=A0ABU7ELQ2_9TELE|nr:hypothetical protein [Characodon lateralis]
MDDLESRIHLKLSTKTCVSEQVNIPTPNSEKPYLTTSDHLLRVIIIPEEEKEKYCILQSVLRPCFRPQPSG